MCSYHGGKQRIGKQLAEVIVDKSLQLVKDEGRIIKGYCEPFCGMLGVYRHIPELFEEEGLKLEYKAGDFNKSVIMMWNEAQKGWKPSVKLVTKTKFMEMKIDGKSSAEKGYIGHYYGYMGKYFQPFDDRHTLLSRERSSKNVSNIGEKMKDVEFSAGSYEKFSNLSGYVIYCDPPYQKQSHYYTEDGKHIGKFDHDKFWKWCRTMAEHNIVFVTEYEAPDDFEKIWSKHSRTTGKTMKENLFVVS
jgi:DNA adenine methylase